MELKEDTLAIKLLPLNHASDEEDGYVNGNASKSSSNGKSDITSEEEPRKSSVTNLIEEIVDLVEVKVSQEEKRAHNFAENVCINLEDTDIADNSTEAKSNPNESILDDDFGEHLTLHEIAILGDINIFKNLITRREREGVDLLRIINAIDRQGCAPIHLAVRYGRKNLVKYLLDKGADIELPGYEDSMTPLLLATKYSMPSIAKLLIQYGAYSSARNIYESTALHYAARAGNEELCRILMGTIGINIDATDSFEATPLHLAMRSRNITVTKLLIDSGAKLHEEDLNGRQPIHVAAEEGQGDLIIELANGALRAVSEENREHVQQTFVNAVRREGDTALHIAAQAGLEETVKKLISIGADVDARNNINHSPLHLAAINGNIGVIQYLVRNNAKIDALDDYQMTPLHRASQFGHIDAVKFLKENGANIEARDENSLSPLMLGVQKGQIGIIDYLLDHGAVLNITDKNNSTVLHKAIQDDNEQGKELRVKILKLLIRRGAVSLVNNIDRDQKTPLHLAAQNGNYEVFFERFCYRDSNLHASHKDSLGKKLIRRQGFRIHIGRYMYVQRPMSRRILV